MKKILIGLVIFAVIVNVIMALVGDTVKETKASVKKYDNYISQYSKANLNIRKLPNKKGEVLKIIKPNDKVITYDSIVNGFVMVLDDTGREYGWTYSKYLQKSPLSKKQFSSIKKRKEKQTKANIKINPLRIDKKIVKDLEYNTVPFDKWEEWGNPKTLEGTNNTYWVVLLPKSNISFVARKKNNFVIFADFGKEKAIKFVNNRKIQDKKTNSNKYANGSLYAAKIVDWKKASVQNKLASCEFIITKVGKKVSRSELEARANDLRICIDEATSGLVSTNNMKVSEVAAPCIVLLGY